MGDKGLGARDGGRGTGDAGQGMGDKGCEGWATRDGGQGMEDEGSGAGDGGHHQSKKLRPPCKPKFSPYLFCNFVRSKF